jgi:hypothetical protein
LLPADLEREIEAAALIRNLQQRVRRLETLEGAGAGCLTLIEDQLLAAAASSVTFSSIPATFKHLWLWINAIADGVGNTDFIRLTFNADSGANYSYTRIRHVLSVHSSAQALSGASHIQLETPSQSGLSRSGQEINIYDYLNASYWKTVTWKSVQFAGAGEEVPSSVHQSHGGGQWLATSPITSLELDKGAFADFGAGSRFTLYGLC